MTRTAQFTIGEKALCNDGPGGTVTRVVVDPVTRTVTIQLGITRQQVDDLPPADVGRGEETS
jgi:hypothetical protein